MNVSFHRTPPAAVAGILELAALALTCRRWFWNIAGIDAPSYTVIPSQQPTGTTCFFLAAAIAALAAWKTGKLSALGDRLRPVLWLLPLLFMPPDFGNLLCVLALAGWCVYRWIPNQKFVCDLIPPKYAGAAAVFLGLSAAGWSFFLQYRAYHSLFLDYHDWGEYTECYLKLASGDFIWREFLARAGHFNPAVNLTMSGLLLLFRAPETVFAVSALLLGSLPPLAWRLARTNRLAPEYAAGCAFLAACNPVLINQSLSMFYGFHPVLFLGPLILGFFIFRAGNNQPGMAAMFILSLLVQETAAVFWFGYAIYLILEKKPIRGIILGIGCIAYFFTVSHLIMPYVFGVGNNPQMFHYQQLGDTPLRVLLSPFLRPEAFFDTLMQKQNIYFTLSLLLPVAPLVLRHPRELTIGIPLLAGVLLQTSVDVKNPAMQYGFDLTVLAVAAAVNSAGELFRRRTAESRRMLISGLAASIVLTVLGAVFWSRIPAGKYSASDILNRPDATGSIDYLRRLSPSAARIHSTRRLRLYFMFDRKTAQSDAPWETGDVIVTDLGDDMEPAETIRRKLLAEPRAIPISSKNFYGRQFCIWRIAPPDTPRPPLPFILKINDADFAGIGIPLPLDNPDFAIRLAVSAKRKVVLLIRLLRRVDYDVEIGLTLFYPDRKIQRRLYFGDGIYPAWAAIPGETYCIELPDSPPSGGEIRLNPIK